ncbi:MAG TPA: hypothetical protein VFD32_21665, partial [Dehalococcoidia bacterium]|nr:hypothetical protein [Dehalococcoidia bacterium]
MLLSSAAAAFVLTVVATAAGLTPWLALPPAGAVGWLLPAARRRQRLWRAVAALGVVAASAWYLPARLATPHGGDVAGLAGRQVRLLVRADDDGDSHPGYVTVSATVFAQLDGDSQQPLGGRLRLLLPPSTDVRAGDRWLVAGMVESVPDGTGYGAWLRQN